jgi:large subunit ribosomal protein L9
MKIVLIADVPDLGGKGSVVDVKEGYARNYLIPRGLAKEATDSVLRALKERESIKEDKAKREVEKAEKAAERLRNARVRIEANAGERGKLFGAVTSKDVADAIKGQLGIGLDKKKVDMEENIRSVGTHKVKIRLHPKVSLDLEVLVEAIESTS